MTGKTPRTRFHPAAMVFWVVGAAIIAGSIPISQEIRDFYGFVQRDYAAGMARGVSWLHLWMEIRGSVRAGGELIGLGIVIEIVDQIRRNALGLAGRP